MRLGNVPSAPLESVELLAGCHVLSPPLPQLKTTRPFECARSVLAILDIVSALDCLARVFLTVSVLKVYVTFIPSKFYSS